MPRKHMPHPWSNNRKWRKNPIPPYSKRSIARNLENIERFLVPCGSRRQHSLNNMYSKGWPGRAKLGARHRAMAFFGCKDKEIRRQTARSKSHTSAPYSRHKTTAEYSIHRHTTWYIRPGTPAATGSDREAHR